MIVSGKVNKQGLWVVTHGGIKFGLLVSRLSKIQRIFPLSLCHEAPLSYNEEQLVCYDCRSELGAVSYGEYLQYHTFLLRDDRKNVSHETIADDLREFYAHAAPMLGGAPYDAVMDAGEFVDEFLEWWTERYPPIAERVKP